MKLDAQIVGNAGLYYTCYHLSLLGWNVMPTARNARGIDVVAHSRDGKRYLGIRPAHLDAVSLPRGRFGAPTEPAPFEIAFLDPEERLPMLLPKAA